MQLKAVKSVAYRMTDDRQTQCTISSYLLGSLVVPLGVLNFGQLLMRKYEQMGYCVPYMYFLLPCGAGNSTMEAPVSCFVIGSTRACAKRAACRRSREQKRLC